MWIFPRGEGYKIKTAYDGMADLNKIDLKSKYIKCSSKHVNIVSIISELWLTSPFSLSTEHVYGHQDTLKISLTMLERLNCKMNIKAKAIAQKTIKERNPHPVLITKLGIGSIICCGESFTSRI